MKFNLKYLSSEFNIQFNSVSLIYTGSDNHIYCITDTHNKKYILRKSLRQKNPEDFAFETNFSLFLSNKNVPVRLLLKAGQLSLLSFCEGETLTFESVTTTQCFNAGKALAHFHLISKQFNQLPLPTRKLTSELERVFSISDKLSKQYFNGSTFVENVKEILNSP